MGRVAGRSVLLQNIGRYQIEAELGKGAMGLVYKATDPNIGRSVALKTLRLDIHGIEQDEMLRRFKNEARSAGVLSHPNIVTIYDAGEDQGLFYIAMEYIEGRTLAEILQEHRVLPVEQVISIARNICVGLDYAHTKGIVHRDIKPANIMITPEGTAKIMDFGIAKVSGSLTSTGQVLGTPNYMSPEQVKGRQLDGRSDLFSLGVMLYEMLTGEKPFMGQGVTTIIYKIVNENPIPPRDLDLTIHPGLSAVVTRMLAKDPYERYQSGSELMRDLESYKSYGSDANATLISATGAFDRAAINGEGDATLIGSAPTIAKPAPPFAQAPAPQPVAAARPSQVPQAAPTSATRVTTTSVPATSTTSVAPVPKVATPPPSKPPANVSQKLAAAGAKGSGKLVIGAVAVVVLIAGLVGVSRHNARKRALLNDQQQFQQAMQQAQQAIELAKQVEQVKPPEVPPAISDSSAAPTDSSAQPPVTPINNSAPADPSAKPAAPEAPKSKPVVKPVTGDLQIVSEPAGAHVEIDGQTRPEWVTPFVAEKLTPGKHNIVYNLPNFTSEKRTTDVVAGRRGSVDAKLVSSVGTIKISSTPAGADILLNGHPTGQKTPASLSLPPGNHAIKLHKEGFQEDSQNVTLALGQTQNIAGHLQPAPAPDPKAETAAKPSGTPASKEANPFSKLGRLFKGGPTEQGTLAISTTPPGARIILNGQVSSSRSPVQIQTKVGKYKVVLNLDGYEPVVRDVLVEKGKQTGISEILVKK